MRRHEVLVENVSWWRILMLTRKAMARMVSLRRVAVVACLLCAGCAARGDRRPAAEHYFDLLEQGLIVSRSQMPAIIASAQEAARRLVSGGMIYVAEAQPGFSREAISRAGGVMSARSISCKDRVTPTHNDVILMGLDGEFNVDEQEALLAWLAKGASIVVFATEAVDIGQALSSQVTIVRGGPKGMTIEVDGQEKLCPTDTLVNAVNLWVWTAECTSACTRLGKMPVHYWSHGLTGGRDRTNRYAGKIFHDDFDIKAIPAGILGHAYLDTVKSCLFSFRSSQMTKLKRAATWYRRGLRTHQATTLTIGHFFPGHIMDSRAPQAITLHESNGLLITQAPETDLQPGQFVFYLGYQFAPSRLINESLTQGYRLVYLTVKPGEPAENIIHLCPGWPLDDGCVRVPGYDVPILPASGVINAAIYWAFLAEVYSG